MEHLLQPGRVKDSRLPVKLHHATATSRRAFLDQDRRRWRKTSGGVGGKGAKREGGRIRPGEIIVEETRGEATNDRRRQKSGRRCCVSAAGRTITQETHTNGIEQRATAAPENRALSGNRRVIWPSQAGVNDSARAPPRRRPRPACRLIGWKGIICTGRRALAQTRRRVGAAAGQIL